MLDGATALDAPALVDAAAELLAQGLDTYQVMVLFERPPRKPTVPPKEWRDASAVRMWLSERGFEPRRQHGGLLLSIEARDSSGAAEQAADIIDRLVSRSSFTPHKLQFSPDACVEGEITAVRLVRARRAEVRALARGQAARHGFGWADRCCDRAGLAPEHGAGPGGGCRRLVDDRDSALRPRRQGQGQHRRSDGLPRGLLLAPSRAHHVGMGTSAADGRFARRACGGAGLIPDQSRAREPHPSGGRDGREPPPHGRRGRACPSQDARARRGSSQRGTASPSCAAMGSVYISAEAAEPAVA